MNQCIDIVEQNLPPCTTVSEATLADGTEVELAVKHGTGQPMVIDWDIAVAWIGDWEYLQRSLSAIVRPSKEVGHVSA